MNTEPSLLIFGEALADVFPDRAVLGGAPFNVARHTARLGVRTALLSRVAADPLGSSIIQACKHSGIDTRLLQDNCEIPTGRVQVHLHAQGGHTFEIESHSAWDVIDPPAFPLMNAFQNAVLVYGTLALRQTHNRHTFELLCQVHRGLRVCDFNWRAGHTPFAVALGAIEQADWLKVSDEELSLLARHLQHPEDDLQGLRTRWCLDRLIVTRGADGYTDVTADALVNGPAFPVDHFEDTVGAGDSFLAATLAAHLHGWTGPQALAFASEFAASICGVRGAVPDNAAHYSPFLSRLTNT